MFAVLLFASSISAVDSVYGTPVHGKIFIN